MLLRYSNNPNMIHVTRWLLVALLALPWYLSSPSNASEGSLRISIVPPGLYEITSGTNAWQVYLDGVIEPGADKRVERELSRISDSVIEVYLNSPGGDFLTGIQMGRLFRAKSAWTHISRQGTGAMSDPGECYSACAMAYLGGYYRFGTKGSKYGVHRTWKDSASTESDLDMGQIISAAASAYIREMGADGGLLDLIVSAGKNELYLLNEAEQKTLRVTNEGRAPAEWSLQLNQGLYYLRGVQDTMYGQGKFLLYCTEQGLAVHSIYEAGPAKSPSIANVEWFHSLLIDSRTVPLGKPSRIKDDHGFLNAMFVLSPEQIKQTSLARESIGHAMQVSREAPTFVGYRVDFNVDTSNKLREFISTCPSKR